MKLFTKTKVKESVPIEQAFELYYPSIFRYFRYRGADADTCVGYLAYPPGFMM